MSVPISPRLFSSSLSSKLGGSEKLPASSKDANAEDAVLSSHHAHSTSVQRERDRRAAQSTHQPHDFAPPPADDDIRLAGAEAALSRIFHRLLDGGAASEAGSSPVLTGRQLSLDEMARADMSTLLMECSLMSLNALGSTAEAKGRALKIMSDAQEALRDKELQAMREQMEKQAEDANKARKGGIFSVIFDWIIAAVETVVGAVKFAVGVMTANPLLVVGGLAEIGAGIAGFGVAYHNTMALTDPDNADKHKAEAQKWGYAQIAFQTVAAVTGVGAAFKGVRAAGQIAKTTKSVVGTQTRNALMTAVKEGNKTAVNQISKKIGQEVAKQVTADVTKRLGTSLLSRGTSAARRRLVKLGFNRMAERFTHTAIEKMVEKGVSRAAMRAMKKGKDVAWKSLEKSMGKSVRRVSRRAAMNGAAALTPLVRETVNGARGIGNGVIAMQRNKLQFEIRDLIAAQTWLQGLQSLYTESKEATLRSMKDVMDAQADILEGAVAAVKANGTLSTRIAASIA